MLPLHALYDLSNTLLEMQWGILREDVSIFERSLTLLGYWAFCIQHENSIKEIAKLSRVFCLLFLQP